MNINLKRATWLSVVAGVVLLCLSGWLWWTKIYQSPKNVFWGAVENNLATTSVTKHTVQKSNSQTLDQYAQLVFGEQPKTHWLTTITQPKTAVTTESIATPDAGYVRYTHVVSVQKNKQGQSLDFSHITNVWAKATAKDNSSLTSLFNQTLLDVSSVPTLPIGNLTAKQRSTLVDYMRKNTVFATTYSAAKHTTVNGQEAYVYTVQVTLDPYLHMMQQFADYENTHVLDSVDPSNYQNSAPVTITLAISPTSHQLVQLSSPSNGFEENYSGYNTAESVSLPAHTIPLAELESRLQKLQ